MASAPPLGVASTLALIAAGVFVVPAIALALTVELPARSQEAAGVEWSTRERDSDGVALAPTLAPTIEAQ